MFEFKKRLMMPSQLEGPSLVCYRLRMLTAQTKNKDDRTFRKPLIPPVPDPTPDPIAGVQRASAAYS